MCRNIRLLLSPLRQKVCLTQQATLLIDLISLASYKDVGTALVTPKTKKGSVPSVTVVAERFAVNVKSGEDIPLAAFFYPPLHEIEGSALKALIIELHKDLHVLFTIATTHHLGVKDSPSTNHLVSS